MLEVHGQRASCQIIHSHHPEVIESVLRNIILSHIYIECTHYIQNQFFGMYGE